MRWNEPVSAPGDYMMVYGSSGTDYFRHICQCGKTVTTPLSELSGWSWPATEALPIFDNMSVSCPCGITEVINGAG